MLPDSPSRAALRATDLVSFSFLVHKLGISAFEHCYQCCEARPDRLRHLGNATVSHTKQGPYRYV